MKGLLNRAVPLAGTIALITSGVLATPASAQTPLASLILTPAPPWQCSPPSVSQPFLSTGDANWYTVIGGEAPDNFSGEGWTLAGGAKIVTAKLDDGQTGKVLDLPSGAVALSPPVCVNSTFAVARARVQDVAGRGNLSFYVSYAGTTTWGIPKYTGQAQDQPNSWRLSDPLNLQPSSTPGWQLARFGLMSGGSGGEFRVYDFYVDPRMT